METIFLRIGQSEKQEYVPKGFWSLNPEDRIEYIKHRWPTAELATNGEPGMWAASHVLK